MEYCAPCGLTYDKQENCYADGIQVAFYPDEAGKKAGVAAHERNPICIGCQYQTEQTSSYVTSTQVEYTATVSFCQAYSKTYRDHRHDVLPQEFTNPYGGEGKAGLTICIILQEGSFRAVWYAPFETGVDLLTQVESNLAILYNQHEDKEGEMYFPMYHMGKGYNERIYFESLDAFKRALLQVSILERPRKKGV